MTCSALSLSLGEALDASAPAERGFLVLELPGPWGRDALADSSLPPDVSGEIAARAKAAGLRVQVVRRTKSRYRPAPWQAWLACISAGRRFLERVALETPADLLALDLTGVAVGRPSDAGVLEDDPLFLACTHGTRDPCCAKLGLPVYRSLSAGAPGRVWHASHLGGHRFAPTIAILPLGVWLGRVPVALGRSLVEDAREGRVPIELLRGRAGLTEASQAADLALRRELGLTDVDDVEVLAADGTEIRLRAGGREWTARTTHSPTGEVRPLSCGAAAKREDPGRWEVVLTGR